MLIDTHCHMNMMVKTTFDTPISQRELDAIDPIIQNARLASVKSIINVGTSLIESDNCIVIARRYDSVLATIGLHPNDATESWRNDMDHFKHRLQSKAQDKIIAIGECGIDRHYAGFNLERQQAVFKTQIELALEHNLPIIVHTRDAGDETLRSLELFKDSNLRGVIHCFSESLAFAYDAIALGFAIGIGGIITYPRNNELRSIVTTIDLSHIILETDAPFLPPQTMRGKQNAPSSIKIIAEYIAQLRQTTLEDIAQVTTATVERLFKLPR
jgi:TatD DNase family protein